MRSFDYVVAGGGLQAGLLVLAIRAHQPSASIALVERRATLGGNHTWCFHHQDVPESARSWLAPLVEWQWDGYSVHFPGQESELDEPYAGVSSKRLHDVVAASFEAHIDSELFLSTDVASVAADRVVLADGGTLLGRAVIDARGMARPEDGERRASSTMRAGYQKFVGQEVRLSAPHGLGRPILMDATVDQTRRSLCGCRMKIVDDCNQIVSSQRIDRALKKADRDARSSLETTAHLNKLVGEFQLTGHSDARRWG